MSSSDGDSQQEKRAVEQEILKCKEKQGSLDDGTVRIHVWASPRSLSTALMYSFAQVKHAQRCLPTDCCWFPLIWMLVICPR